MYGLPFPEASPEHAEASTSEQLLLRKEVAQRFGHSGTYRDLPFAVRSPRPRLATTGVGG